MFKLNLKFVPVGFKFTVTDSDCSGRLQVRSVFHTAAAKLLLCSRLEAPAGRARRPSESLLQPNSGDSDSESEVSACSPHRGGSLRGLLITGFNLKFTVTWLPVCHACTRCQAALPWSPRPSG
jgi:hypothetical protein